MAPTNWIGLGFVATAVNASPEIIATTPVTIVCPQVCFGMGYPENDPGLEATRQLISGCKNCGLGVAGWAWCCNPDRAEEEASYHAAIVGELGLSLFIANMEEPYDAHGNQSDPRMFAPDRYAQVFRAVSSAELGLTTTPRWGSSGNGMRSAGAVIMPQAFTGDVPDATIPNCVSHAQAWGWTVDRIRPLVQVYAPRPNADTYNADALACNVGVVPYVVEQAFDDEGMNMVKTLAPSIQRPPAPAPKPPEPIPPEPAKGPPEMPFKGALYPPDAKEKGKTPSPDSPQVVAIKRGISRAGYWKWQSFDDSYSNAFAHGGSSGPGVEGFQGAHVDLKGKPPSGWYGSATHEALRTFVLPSGPNKGQWAFDATAVNLYNSS